MTRSCFLIASFAVIVLANSTSANGQGGLLETVEGLFGPKRAARAGAPVVRNTALINDVDALNFKNQYSPFLMKALTVELHFVNKVCDPSPDQFNKIHIAGIRAVANTAKQYEELQRVRQATNSWPDPREQITKALQKEIEAILPEEKVKAYSEELDYRKDAKQDASVGMMLVHIDRELYLTPDQYKNVSKAVKEKWNRTWSTGPRLFMYPQYARMPESHVLRDHLTERQQSLWNQRNNNTSVSFGWQMELGLQDWFGGQELPAFEKPVIDVAEADTDGEDTDEADTDEDTKLGPNEGIDAEALEPEEVKAE